jgi:hypothetical protein
MPSPAEVPSPRCHPSHGYPSYPHEKRRLPFLPVQAVVRLADDAAPAFTGGQIGVGGGAVRPLSAAGLTAIVGSVARSEFGEAALRQNLEDRCAS